MCRSGAIEHSHLRRTWARKYQNWRRDGILRLGSKLCCRIIRRASNEYLYLEEEENEVKSEEEDCSR